MYDIYFQVLSVSYAFWNSIRIFSYMPTILKLRRAEACADSYSQVTWVCWIFSNLTYTLMLYETNGNRIDGLVLVPASNVLFCSITSFYIWKLQRRIPGRQSDFVHFARDVRAELMRYGGLILSVARGRPAPSARPSGHDDPTGYSGEQPEERREHIPPLAALVSRG